MSYLLHTAAESVHIKRFYAKIQNIAWEKAEY